MRIALVHYHLKSGGVTSVIYNQARSLVGSGADVLIIAGEPPPIEITFPFALVKELAYDAPGMVLQQADIEAHARGLADDIERVIKNHWGTGADIVHIHNPLIQKNSLLIPAIKILGIRGIRLFLQNHDLAEDFRPDVYTGSAEYPENCHYGVINSRDYDFLRSAGLTEQGLHLIPNEVFPLKSKSGLKRTRYLYPVRAIRRKNIGEALLLSLFLPDECTVAITLPASQKDDAHYRRWQAFAIGLGLPVEFEMGLQYSLEELLGTSVCAISTSVKEGFGFSFLEPWTAGLNLFGRRINYVCADFEHSGVCFNHLYSSLNIPFDHVSDKLPQKMESAIRRIYEAFGYAAPDSVIRFLADDMAHRKTIDFGRLDEPLQEEIIRAACKKKHERKIILDLNPCLDKLKEPVNCKELIDANNRVISEKYGKERITYLLFDIYKKIIDKPVTQKLSKPALLELFLNPQRLFLVGISDG